MITESNIIKHIELISEEIKTAMSCYYTWLFINNFSSIDPDNYNKLNQNAHFWNTTLYSLQLSYFIILGKIIYFHIESYSNSKLLKINALKSISEYYLYFKILIYHMFKMMKRTQISFKSDYMRIIIGI